MFHLILIVHMALCAFLVGVVLLQQGKGADAGAVLGGGAESIFGAGGAGSFMSRLTTATAIAFMISSIVLVKAYGGRGSETPVEVNVLQGSVTEGLQPAVEPEAAAPAPAVEVKPAEPAPAAPAAPAAGTDTAPPAAAGDAQPAAQQTDKAK